MICLLTVVVFEIVMVWIHGSLIQNNPCSWLSEIHHRQQTFSAWCNAWFPKRFFIHVGSNWYTEHDRRPGLRMLILVSPWAPLRNPIHRAESDAWRMWDHAATSWTDMRILWKHNIYHIYIYNYLYIYIYVYVYMYIYIYRKYTNCGGNYH